MLKHASVTIGEKFTDPSLTWRAVTVRWNSDHATGAEIGAAIRISIDLPIEVRPGETVEDVEARALIEAGARLAEVGQVLSHATKP